MKRKRGNAKSKSWKLPVVRSDESASDRSTPNVKVPCLGDLDFRNIDSRMETETLRPEADVSDWQPNVGKQQASDGRMEFCPDSLRKMIISVVKDLSEEAEGITSKPSADFGISSDSRKGYESPFQPHGEMIPRENLKVLHDDPQNKEHELKAALSVIKKIMKLDAAEPFSIPVDPIALGIPDYFDVTDTPMDFGTICDNLKKGLKYINSEEVYKDVQYIWENCYTYNKKGDYILELMDEVRTKFLTYWTAAGLYTEHASGDDGYSNLPPSSKSTMRRSPQTKSCTVNHVTHKVAPSAGQHSICTVLSKQPQSSSSQQQLSILNQDIADTTGTADAIYRSSGGEEFSPLTPPVLSILRGNERGNECSVSNAANKTIHRQQDDVDTNQEQVYQSPLIYPEAYEPLLNSNHQLPSPQHESSSMKKKYGRGPSRFLELLTTKGRISVAVNELGVPIGDEAPKLTSFLGLMAQDGQLVPLTYPSWTKMPNENKEKMWQIVQSRFDVDPLVKSWVMKSLANRWRNFKCLLKANHYDTHETNEERLADRDSRVLPDQWPILVSQWSSEKWQNTSAQNKANRAKQKFYHTSGSKSFARVFEEEKAKRPDGKEPTRAELFILTRTRKNGQPINDKAASIISQLRERSQQQETLESNSQHQVDIFSQVMGPPGRTCSLIYGIGSSSDMGAEKPIHDNALRIVPEEKSEKPIHDNALRIVPEEKSEKPILDHALRVVHEEKSEVREMKEKVASMEQTCAQMAAQMAAMMSMMASMQKTSLANHIPNVVSADVSDASEDSPKQPAQTSTSRRPYPLRQTSARKKT